MLLTKENTPDGRLEKCGFLGAAFITYNLALEAHFRARLANEKIPVNFIAYTGESLGILAAIVASGSLSCRDAIKIANIFEPLVLLYSGVGSEDSSFARQLKSYLPCQSNGNGTTTPQEPAYVIALKAQPDELERASAGIARFYSTMDIEAHKEYSNNQNNYYVRASLKQEFTLFMKNFPLVKISLLKGPTKFLAHSTKMREIREALAQFIRVESIVFRDPHTPIIPNHAAAMIKSGREAQLAVLAIADQIMESRATAKEVEELHPNLVLEFGLGRKSIKLLNDNCPDTLTAEYTGSPLASNHLVNSIKEFHQINCEIWALRSQSSSLRAGHYNSIREYFKRVTSNNLFEALLHANILEIINQGIISSHKAYSPIYYQYLEILQHTYHYRNFVDLASGEIIVNARVKKKITDKHASSQTIHTEIKIQDEHGCIRIVELEDVNNTELIVFHFDQNVDMPLDELYHNMQQILRTQPQAKSIWCEILRDLHIDQNFLCRNGECRNILPANLIIIGYMVYKHIVFRLLTIHRPAIFAQNTVLFMANDRMGWLLALASTGAVSIVDALQFYTACLKGDTYSEHWNAALERFVSSLKMASECIINLDGSLLQSKKDLEAATRRLFLDDEPSIQKTRSLALHGNSNVISIGSPLSSEHIDASIQDTRIISIESPEEIWNKHSNTRLTHFDKSSIWSSTRDNRMVLKYAKSRKIPSSTIYSYIAHFEKLIGFGLGGSESMTMFIAKDDNHGI